MSAADLTLFPGFTSSRVKTSEAEIAIVVGGSGPPLLLLHGYPQTHAIWHKIAVPLSQHFTVVGADLRGYGDSSKPDGGEKHVNYSKRAMATDQVEVMKALGFGRFHLVGHDRGGRVAHWLALDFASCVDRLVVLDISPTRTMYAGTNQAFATAYYHWFFLIQPFDLPERLIGADPAYYLGRKIGAWSGDATHFSPKAIAEYQRCFSNPATIHATCEDYRAAATIDLEHDAVDAERKLTCPLLVLWGEKGVVHRLFNPISDWRQAAHDVRGKALPCGHYLPEEAPDQTLQELLNFLLIG